MKRLLLFILFLSLSSVCFATDYLSWRLNDNDSTTTVIGEVNGVLIGGDSCDVATMVNGYPAFHFNGSDQYVKVKVPKMWPSAVSQLWTECPNNPVIPYDSYAYFGQLTRNPYGEPNWYFFTGGYNPPDQNYAVTRYDSNDLITWSNKMTVLRASTYPNDGKWDKIIQVATCFQDTNGLWNLFYRGFGNSHIYKIGKATSTDGITFTKVTIYPDQPGLLPLFKDWNLSGTNYDPVGRILVNGTYYLWVSGQPLHNVQNVYTSTDLQNWTCYPGNPIFTAPSTDSDGAFCSSVFKYGDYYYLLICRDMKETGVSLYDHGIGLYRSVVPVFDANNRDFLGYIKVNNTDDAKGYLDTPSVNTKDIYGEPYGFGDTLYCMYSAWQAWGGSGAQSLVSTTLTELSARTPKVHRLHGEKQTYSFWVQADKLPVPSPATPATYTTTFWDPSGQLLLTANPENYPGVMGNAIKFRAILGGWARVWVGPEPNITLVCADWPRTTTAQAKAIMDACSAVTALVSVSQIGNCWSSTSEITGTHLSGGENEGNIAPSAIFSIGSAKDDSTPVRYMGFSGNKLVMDVNGILTNIASVEADTPYRIALVDSIDKIEVYVNGVLVYTTTMHNAAIDDTYLYLGTGYSNSAQKYLAGSIWDFRIYPRALTAYEVLHELNIACNPFPADKQTGVDCNIELQWEPAAVSAPEVNEYRVYFSTDFNSVDQGTVGYVCVNEPNYAPGILDIDTTYYWRVDEIIGSEIYRGFVWRFTTRLRTASEPYPANNADGVPSNVELSWTVGVCVADTNGHDVYFGTNSSDVAKGRRNLVSDMDGDGQVNFTDLWVLCEQWLGYAEESEPQADLNGNKAVDLSDFAIMTEEWQGNIVYKGRQTANQYDPCSLEYGVTYFWRVDECNESNVWPGPVWNFTVGN